MRSITILKHDVYAHELLTSLHTPSHTTIQQNLILYSPRNRMVAEIDILIEHKDSIRIYEVKCSFRLLKAKRQLMKIKKLLSELYDKPIELYFYNGASKEVVAIEC